MKKLINIFVVCSAMVLLTACVEENYSQSHYSSRVNAAPVANTSYSSSARTNRYVTPSPVQQGGYGSRVDN